MFSILANFLPSKIVVFDVGARGGNWGNKALRQLLKDGYCRLVGFEPDEKECEKLNEATPANETYYPFALSEIEGKKSFYRTHSAGNCTFYRPRKNYLNQFVPGDQYAVENIVDMPVTTLDTFLKERKLKPPDFLKMDVEGSELDILKGGNKALESVFGIELEVWFNQIYEGQPLFYDVHNYLQERGFTLFDAARSNFFKRKAGQDLKGPKGQLMCGDALFFRDMDSSEFNSRFLVSPNIEKCLTILVVYGYYDYALELLDRAKPNSYISRDISTRWMKRLKKNGKDPIPAFRGRYRLSHLLKKLAFKFSVKEKDFLGNQYE